MTEPTKASLELAERWLCRHSVVPQAERVNEEPTFDQDVRSLARLFDAMRGDVEAERKQQVKAYERGTIDGASDERARIVAKLRAWAACWPEHDMWAAANVIERGKHEEP